MRAQSRRLTSAGVSGEVRHHVGAAPARQARGLSQVVVTEIVEAAEEEPLAVMHPIEAVPRDRHQRVLAPIDVATLPETGDTRVIITPPSRKNSLGLRALPTPPGVPVAMTSPGSSVMTVEM